MWLVGIVHKIDHRVTAKTFRTTSSEKVVVTNRELCSVQERKKVRKEGNCLLRELDLEEEDFFLEQIGEVLGKVK